MNTEELPAHLSDWHNDITGKKIVILGKNTVSLEEAESYPAHCVEYVGTCANVIGFAIVDVESHTTEEFSFMWDGELKTIQKSKIIIVLCDDDMLPECLEIKGVQRTRIYDI